MSSVNHQQINNNLYQQTSGGGPIGSTSSAAGSGGGSMSTGSRLQSAAGVSSPRSGMLANTNGSSKLVFLTIPSKF